MPALAGIKRLREDFDDDLKQFQDGMLEAISQSNGTAAVEEALKSLQEAGNSMVSTPPNPPNPALGLRVVLQHVIEQASISRQPLMMYKVSSDSSLPAVRALLSAAVDLAKKESMGAGEVFQLVEDIVETNKIDDVKACFNFMESHWEELRMSKAKLEKAVLLRFQKACNMFTRRVSNDQDAEILGAVALQVAKMLPFNDKAGLNAQFSVNQHETPMDAEAGASVDGSEPIDYTLYQQLWQLQNAFQDPHDQAEPNKWARTVSSIQAVLSKLQDEPTGVASRSTAVPQDGGKSIIVKYLTSSKLTKLQLRDAAFRRTLLVQCLVLLHACEHPKWTAAKGPTRELKERQTSELNQLQQKLYEELAKTPEQGPAFSNVVRMLLERETAFVRWKCEGANPYWDLSGSGPQQEVSLNRALPKVPTEKAASITVALGNEPDTKLPLDRSWDTYGSEEDVYRQNRDQQMLPTTEKHFAQVGRELAQGDFRRRNQYANAKAVGGVDPLYVFRAQRMLQRKSMSLWQRTTQMEQPGERLECAFADLYPEKVPPGWQRPRIEDRSSDKHVPKKPGVKPSATRSASDASEGVKQQTDQVMDDATPPDADAVEAAAEALVKTDTDMAADTATANGLDANSTAAGPAQAMHQAAAAAAAENGADATQGGRSKPDASDSTQAQATTEMKAEDSSVGDSAPASQRKESPAAQAGKGLSNSSRQVLNTGETAVKQQSSNGREASEGLTADASAKDAPQPASQGLARGPQAPEDSLHKTSALADGKDFKGADVAVAMHQDQPQE